MKRTFALTAAVLILLPFTVAATALELPYSLQGKVLAVNELTRTLTVKADESPLPATVAPMNNYTFRLGAMTNVLMCDQNKTPGDIKAGDRVEVKYHERKGNLIADTVVITTPLIACLIP